MTIAKKKTLEGFGSTMDLQNLEDNLKAKLIGPPEYLNTDFVEFAFLDVSTVDTDWNAGVREKRDKRHIETLEASYDKRGFDMSVWPPSIDQNREIIDGRSRIDAAKKKGETHIPVAVFKRSDLTNRNRVTNGILANMDGMAPLPTTYRDVVVGGFDLIECGELPCTSRAIKEWLEEIGVDNMFTAPSRSQMLSSILKRVKAKKSIIINKTPLEWHAWISDNLGLKKNSYALVNLNGNESYSERAFTRRILAHCQKYAAQWKKFDEEKDEEKGEQAPSFFPLLIIFYTAGCDVEVAQEGLTEAMENLEKLCQGAYAMVNIVLGCTLNAKMPPDRPYKILGAVPQVRRKHAINGSKLVDIDASTYVDEEVEPSTDEAAANKEGKEAIAAK